MWTMALVFALVLTTACTGAVHRDGLCLALLTPEYLDAERTVSALRETLPSDEARQAALAHYQTVTEWQERVAKRLLTRLEERTILSETFFALLSGGPMIVFYPLVRWNVRSVLWEDSDPDDAADPVTQYCEQRLSEDQADGL